jgi:hypothetical protein
MRALPFGIRQIGIRRRLVALMLAYLLALQGGIVAWATVAAVAATVSPATSVICSSGHHGDAPHQSDGTLPCCACGPMCVSCASPAAAAAPELAAFMPQRLPVALQWSVEPTDALSRAHATHWQARAPPLTA